MYDAISGHWVDASQLSSLLHRTACTHWLLTDGKVSDIFWFFGLFFVLQLLLTLLSVLCQREDLFFTVVWLVG